VRKKGNSSKALAETMRVSDGFLKAYGKYGDDNKMNTYIMCEREREGEIRKKEVVKYKLSAS
jgi:hypothetical protein